MKLFLVRNSYFIKSNDHYKHRNYLAVNLCVLISCLTVVQWASACSHNRNCSLLVAFIELYKFTDTSSVGEVYLWLATPIFSNHMTIKSVEII